MKKSKSLELKKKTKNKNTKKTDKQTNKKQTNKKQKKTRNKKQEYLLNLNNINYIFNRTKWGIKTKYKDTNFINLTVN